MKNDKWLDLTNGVCWSIIFSLAAIIMSIVALADTHPRVLYSANGKTVVLGFDYIGVIVGILALLVTCLVAWNIWQVFDTKNTVRKAEEASEKIQEFEKEIERNKNIHRPYLAYNEGMRYFDAQNYSSAVNYFLSMVEMYVDYEIEFNNFMSTAIDNAIICVQKEPWNFRHRLFIDRVDNAVGRLRKLNNTITPLDAQLSRIRKELEKICEEKIPNPYPLPGEQNVNDPNGN
ncbi:MAG: hypothetical protein ACI3Z7_05405 [Candidatus Aphodosoma sp.]